MIVVKNLSKEFATAKPLKDVNTVIERGEVIVIIGPSGAGKSTFIRCLNMLEVPTSGEILVDGEAITNAGYDVKKLRQKMGMVFQHFNLFPHLTVIENIMMAPMDLLGKSKQDAYDRAIELLQMVGLVEKELCYPNTLSGGQKQRVAIARALAMGPEIMLFDEPTSALDPAMVGEVEIVIRDLAKQGMTMLIVTHDMRFAREVASRVFYMDEGVIYEEGTPDQVFDHPQREKTIRFIRRTKVLDGVIESRSFDFIETMSRIEAFCRRHLISLKTAYRLQMAFEELCVHLLIPELGDSFKLRYSLEYSKEHGIMELWIRYTGAAFNPLEEGDELSVSIVEGIAQRLTYRSIEDGEYTNVIEVAFAV